MYFLAYLCIYVYTIYDLCIIHYLCISSPIFAPAVCITGHWFDATRNQTRVYSSKGGRSYQFFKRHLSCYTLTRKYVNRNIEFKTGLRDVTNASGDKTDTVLFSDWR